MITAAAIGQAVRELVLCAAFELREDYAAALSAAIEVESSARAKAVIGQLLENARIAAADRVPLCQDTGTGWVRVDLGADETLTGDVQAEVDRAVADAYSEGALRMSLVRDALFDRTNTGDNTPAFVDVAWRPGTGATVTVMLKGGGSDNASRVVMLNPDAGGAGVIDTVIAAVSEKATGACPPLVIGVGVGSTFDKVGTLAKKALLRRIGSPATNDAADDLEARLLEAVNATGIGPAGLGGHTTALAVHIVTAPSHIAALPVAVNLGCCAMRSASTEVVGV